MGAGNVSEAEEIGGKRGEYRNTSIPCPGKQCMQYELNALNMNMN